MRVYILANGNKEIGMGHVMRSLSLAEAFRERGHFVSFFSKYSLGIEIIKSKNFDVQNLENIDVVHLKFDSLKIPDVIVVDSYDVTVEFFVKLKKCTKCLVYIDDLNAFFYPVDMIVNGTASAINMLYGNSQSAKLLLGLQYNLLRKEFSNLPKREAREDIKDILITTGNSDPAHMTEKVLQIFIRDEKYAKLKFQVIVGDGFEDDIWREYGIINHPSVFLHHKPDNMARIMMGCDIAVTAGGSTLYELAACGVPAIVFAYAENQVPQAEAMGQKKLIWYLGQYMSVTKEKMDEAFRYLQKNYEIRKELVEKLQILVDAQGASRVVKEIEKNCLMG